MKTGFPLDRIIFEFTENEQLDTKHILHILRTYRDMGFKTAIDDFGAGHSGLGLLTHFQPDIVKLDMDMIRGIDTDPLRRTIVKHTLHMLEDLAIVPLCEGVETAPELHVLRDLGVSLIQGYVLAKPSFESLAVPIAPETLSAGQPDQQCVSRNCVCTRCKLTYWRQCRNGTHPCPHDRKSGTL